MSEWSKWSIGCCIGKPPQVSLTKTRTRSVVTPPSNGGKECGETEEHKFEEIRQCPVDRSCISDCTDKLPFPSPPDILNHCKHMEDKCVYENGWPVLGMMKNCGKTCCGKPARNPDKKFDTLRNLCQTCEETKEGRFFSCLRTIL